MTAKILLEQNFGVKYPKETFAILFDMINDEGWSEERFQRTLKWFLKTKYNQAWTISDWFQYGVKLYPVQWMHEQINKMGNPPRAWERFERYRINGVVAVKLKDGIDLPFERIS